MVRVTSSIRRLFHIPLWGDKMHKFKTDTAEAYGDVYGKLLKSIRDQVVF